MMEMTTSSPGLRSQMPARPFAARLSASEALRTNTTSSASGAPMKRATWARARAMASVASMERR